MTPEALAMCDDLGNTALNVAALVGNTEAAVILVKKNLSLLYIRNDRGWLLPIHRAALCAHKDTLLYILCRHKVDTAPEFLMDQFGVELLVYVIESGFFDVAMDLVQSYPKLAKTKQENGDSALKTVAKMASAFPSGNHSIFWQNSIFSCAPLKMEKKNNLEDPNICDIENLNHTSQVPMDKYSLTWFLPQKYCVSVWRKVQCLIWDFIKFLGNNILHLAARLAPLEKLHLVSGAALQMQSAIQWFKEVENFVVPTYKEKKNSDKETPAMVFFKEHKDLITEGEKWMKDTANSFIIAAALIATVVFAAAVTVPGGDDQNTGFPLLNKYNAFLVFAISDAISLFTSVVSMLMFLSLLTSRYEEWDFLDVLPKRLIIGLLTLFISTTSMMISFSASLYLVFGCKSVWHLIALSALGFLPIICFAALQFPLLVDVICSTYGPGIFGKRSDVPFY